MLSSLSQSNFSCWYISSAAVDISQSFYRGFGSGLQSHICHLLVWWKLLCNPCFNYWTHASLHTLKKDTRVVFNTQLCGLCLKHSALWWSGSAGCFVNLMTIKIFSDTDKPLLMYKDNQLKVFRHCLRHYFSWLFWSEPHCWGEMLLPF